MSNEFKVDGAGEGYGYTDRDGAGLLIFRARLGHLGEDLYVGVDGEDGSHRAAYVNGKELCGAIAKTLGFKVRFEDELHNIGHVQVKVTEVEKPVERQAIEVQDAINETIAKLAEPEWPELWTNVRYRQARAVEVTPELVDFLRVDTIAAKLPELKPWYSETSGQPGGVTYYDPMILDDVKVGMGVYVVLRQGQVPQVLDQKKFEDIYEEAA